MGTSQSLQYKNTDFQKDKNTLDHRTSDYDTEKLVVRRGKSFNIILNFNKPVKSGDVLRITVKTGSDPSESRNTQAEMEVSSSGSGTGWSAVRGKSSGNSLPITVNPPVTAVVGRYEMSLQLTRERIITYFNLGTFVLLFNPWLSGDEVYLNSEEEKREYVLNESGLYWAGNKDNFIEKPWNYGQFDKDILDICLTLLDRSSYPGGGDYKRNDPLYVGRELSYMVNYNGKNHGVLWGKWSKRIEDYSDGVHPGRWNGSVPILRKWIQSGPVKYGQCWVFGGVLCTVLRCLGIPARVIVNFKSGHDTDRNLLIDEYYDAKSKKITELTKDSIWNFHVWNEMWSTRKDLGSSYNGWQILDATPQELSEGEFRLGPCSLEAIKKGDVDLKYDTPFVFAEVDADVCHWMIDKGPPKLIYRNYKTVGKNTSTKAVGSFTRVEVTNGYKFPDGSKEERDIFEKAVRKLRPKLMTVNYSSTAISVQTADGEEVAVKPEFSAIFKNGVTQVGEDLIMELTLKSTATVTRTVKVNMAATAIIYNSTPVKEILTNSQSVTLRANEEKRISLKITYSQYKNAITPDNLIEVVALCEDDKGEILLVDKVVTLKNPPLLFRVMQQAKLDKSSTVEILFTNPINEPINDSVLIIEGSGLMKEPFVVRVPLIKEKEKVALEFEITPYRVGERYLYADFSSKAFSHVKAFQSVAVAKA